VGKGKAVIRRVLRRHKVLGLDTVCFIYFFEDNPQYVPFVQPLFEFIEDGVVSGIASTIAMMEVLVKPKREKNDVLVSQYEFIFETYPNLTIYDCSRDIAKRASGLKARYELRAPDSIQIATALEGKADAFIANDDYLKRIEEIEIIVMREMLEL
jgi:predicted nucleic acid-binding protein